jgi:hypothetical protein
MSKAQRNLTFALAAIFFMAVGAVGYAQLGKIIKGGAIALAVDRFGPDIDKAINSLVNNKDLRHDQATKVVPILSIGTGEYAGAVQVTGDDRVLSKVKAVAQLETQFRIPLLKAIRLRALVPIEARSVTNLKRVPGVGVSALVDIKL